jgi:hypothetical protein
VTAANADQIAAQARDLAAWIGSRKASPPVTGTRAAAQATTRASIGRAPHSDAEKAAAISSTWQTLRARQQGAA